MRITALAVSLLVWAGIAGAASAPKAAPAPKGPKPPPLERFTCRTGPNDEQARLIAQVVKGRTMEFAYYSRLGTRVCSIHARRGDAYSKWADDGSSATVRLLKGTAAVDYKPGHLKIKFDDVDRMTYCGMHGEINASIEAMKNKSECQISGVFDLGSAAQIDEPPKAESKQEEAKKEEAKMDEPRKEDRVQEGSKPQEVKPEGSRPGEVKQEETAK